VHGRDRPKLSAVGSGLGELIVGGVDTTGPIVPNAPAEEAQNCDYNIHWLEHWLPTKRKKLRRTRPNPDTLTRFRPSNRRIPMSEKGNTQMRRQGRPKNAGLRMASYLRSFKRANASRAFAIVEAMRPARRRVERIAKKHGSTIRFAIFTYPFKTGTRLKRRG
jgi:hypothetical protein